MREIKFRIRLKALSHVNGYDKGCELTIYNEIFKRENGISFWSIEQEWEILSRDQFTGLTDKNGKEIYEGDILSWGEPYDNEKITFKKGSFGYEKNDFTSLNEEFFKTDNVLLFAEVIGNIHENPELL